MSLNWNLESIQDYKTVCWIEQEDGTTRLNPVTETLIFMTMSVQMGSITEANADEFYARLKIIEALDGPFLYKNEDGKHQDRFFTPEDVQAHIGLACNVTTESTAKFFGHLRTQHFKTFKGQYKASLRKEVTA